MDKKGKLAAVLESCQGQDEAGREERITSPSEPFISLIMCCKSPKGFGREYKRTSEDLDFVPMIGMNSMAEGYNLGAKKAKAISWFSLMTMLRSNGISRSGRN